MTIALANIGKYTQRKTDRQREERRCRDAFDESMQTI